MNHSTIARTLTRGIRLSAAAALLTGLLAVTQPARAGTYEVTIINDSGPGSLRQAITDAINHTGPDTITFHADTDGHPIVLAGAAGEDANASGDLDIRDKSDLTIQGNGATNTIIDGGGIDRVFHVCPGGGCANTVTLSDMTIRNGSADFGGGIYNRSGTTALVGCIIHANMALNVGGGIINYDTLIVHNSTIGGVGASNTANFNGGGIYNGAGTTTVVGSTVSANMATEKGGGIYNYGTLTVQNGSTIGGAGAANTANYGGGIYNSGGTTTVTGSTVSANEADNDGGGIYNSGGTTTVIGSTVSANEADRNGGGIYNKATLNIQNGSTIGGAGGGNQAWAGNGGGIYNRAGTTTVIGSTVSDNTANRLGGGIYNRAGTTTVDGSTVSANAADDGGGIYNWAGATTVTGSRILNNTASIEGGGVFNESLAAWATSVTGSCIVGNSAKSFFNKQVAHQIATGNWWGAATGPNTPGADTVGGNVDTSGYLTEPILGCGPYVYLPLVLK